MCLKVRIDAIKMVIEASTLPLVEPRRVHGPVALNPVEHDCVTESRLDALVSPPVVLVPSRFLNVLNGVGLAPVQVGIRVETQRPEIGLVRRVIEGEGA